jgi:hypothetical protein
MRKPVVRLVLATLLGAVALIAWGMIFWGLLAGPLGMFHALPDAEGVAALLERTGTATGTYFAPWPRDTPEAFEQFVAHHERGGFFMVKYIAEGVDPQSPTKLLVGSLQYLTVAAMAVGLLSLSAAPRYSRRVAIVVIAGAIGTNFITLADPIWFHLPWDYTIGAALYELVSWTLLGLSTAALLPVPAAQD